MVALVKQAPQAWLMLSGQAQTAGSTCALMKSTGEVANARQNERRRAASRARATSAAIRWSICGNHISSSWGCGVRSAANACFGVPATSAGAVVRLRKRSSDITDR